MNQTELETEIAETEKRLQAIQNDPKYQAAPGSFNGLTPAGQRKWNNLAQTYIGLKNQLSKLKDPGFSVDGYSGRNSRI